MPLCDRVRRTMRAHALAAPGTRVLAAVSGGADSVALAHVLAELDAAGELQFRAIAHFNHRLRNAAEEDEAFSRRLAATLGRTFVSDRGDVRAFAASQRCSIEDAGRRLRHAFLERARAHVEADVIALGHTRDDQAETFLLRLVRGAGSRGLAAMHPRRGRLIRPLLECRRAELREYLSRRHTAFVHDPSNDDVAIPRNRVRAELLPLLEARFNPSVVDALADAAEIARGEWQLLEELAAPLLRDAVTVDGATRRVDVDALAGAPVAVVRRVLAHVLTDGAHGRPVTFAHVEAARALFEEDAAPVDGPGQRMQRLGRFVTFTSWGERRGRPPAAGAALKNFFRFSLSIPGEVACPGGWLVSAQAAPGASERAAACTEPAAVSHHVPQQLVQIRLDRIRQPLFVRNRRPGDRFAPPGMAGRKTLQDYFVDRKVPRERREDMPIVVDADDRIVWVAGHAPDREFAVTDPAQAVIILRLKQLGGGS